MRMDSANKDKEKKAKIVIYLVKSIKSYFFVMESFLAMNCLGAVTF